MFRLLGVSLIGSMLFATWYFYQLGSQVCPLPLTYRLGELDERFGLSPEAARSALLEAEAVWEEALNEDIFVYDAAGTLVVDFIFDERQATTNAEDDFRNRLDTAASVNESVQATYLELVDEYEALKATYEDRLEVFEADQATYNATVAQYNAQGGAPQEDYDRLRTERTRLDAEQRALEASAERLGALVAQINEVGQRGNLLIERYNDTVTQFNQRFGAPREFTQGDYQNDTITIYTFTDNDELVTVLAHEFGHALSLDHVDDSTSIMHYLIGDQPIPPVLSASDRAVFQQVCRGLSLWGKIQYRLFN